MNHKNYFIWGSSGHSKVLAEILQHQGDQVLALFDSSNTAISSLPGVPLYFGLDSYGAWVHELKERGEGVFGALAIGGSKGVDRQILLSQLKKMGAIFPKIIHPTAFVSESAYIGEGSQILVNSVVNTDVTVGNVTIVNTGAKIDHECRIGNGVHIAPGASLCGCITVLDNAMIGAGAVVLPRVIIGYGAIVGAGAVVTKNVPDGAVVVGNPARLMVK